MDWIKAQREKWLADACKYASPAMKQLLREQFVAIPRFIMEEGGLIAVIQSKRLGIKSGWGLQFVEQTRGLEREFMFADGSRFKG